VLVGRDVEQARIATLLEDARSGDAGVLVVRGEPGVGKTTLLDTSIRQASDFRLLACTGVQSEHELPFAGLHSLLRPLLTGIDNLPAPQAAALRSAFAIAPSTGGDAFAVFAGVLGLLANAAADGPVLVVVDDAQFIDRASSEALGFTLRRLRDEPIAVLIGTRTEEPTAFDTDGLPWLDIEPLGDADAVALLRSVAPDVAAGAQQQILGLARGNPLALVELPRLYDLGPGAAGGPQGLKRSSGLLTHAFGRRIEALSEHARLAVIVAAAEEQGHLETVLRACSSLGIQTVDVEAAEASGIMWIRGDRLEFRHPLVRAVAYADASPASRRSAHRAVAEALQDPAARDLRAWHSALAAVEPDDAIANLLENIGRRTVATSPGAAQAAFQEAARLSTASVDRSRRLFAAAEAAESSGQLAAAQALAESAGAIALDEMLAAEVAHLVGRVRARLGDPTAIDALIDAAARAEVLDPERAALMLADAVEVAVDFDLEQAESLARSAWQLTWPRGGGTEQLITLRYADTLGWRGDVRPATELWRRAGSLATADDPERLRLAAEALFSAGDDAEASTVATQAVAVARSGSSLNVLTRSLEFLALSEARRGRLQAGLDAITEGLDLLSALRQVREEMYACGVAAWIYGSLGLEAPCREHARRGAEIGGLIGQPFQTGAALGILELSLGRSSVAADTLLERVAQTGERLAGDAIAPRPIVPILVEALVRAGRGPEAIPFVPQFEAVAQQSERPLVLAFAERMRALVDDSIDRLAASVALFAEAGNRYEQARTELLLGEALRRERRRGVARPALRSAVEGFDSVGASGWAVRARAELAATGETVRRDQIATNELTPQERVVARLVVQGFTNKQIAEQLFLSPNTIETHLRHIFQKADVRTRTQLAHVLPAE
jgi:DNA-binding CsgD family transcriptional regulator